MTPEPARLYWKFLEGHDDGLDDLGPAWLEQPDGTLSKVNGGDWITRSEARWLAREYGYDLREEG